MKHPWEKVNLSDYEGHMSLEQVYQLQTLNNIMKCQMESCKGKCLAIWGVAGGNGLEHAENMENTTIYGVDINQEYLDSCVERYPKLGKRFVPLRVDLSQGTEGLQECDLIIADLLVEYIGIKAFARNLGEIKTRGVSCVIQVNPDNGFVSESPYLNCFDEISTLHKDVDPQKLSEAMQQTGYKMILKEQYPLPNGKVFIRLDFEYNM